MHAWILLLLSASAGAASPALTVFPSGSSLVQNALRITIAFDEPQPSGRAADLVLEVNGKALDSPFVSVPLWSPDQRRLTVLLHPGRQKQGLDARQRLGAILTEGAQARLLVGGTLAKQWTVAPADHRGPVLGDWEWQAPAPDSRDALVLRLDDAVDAQAADLIAVAAQDGSRVRGTAALRNSEREWHFVPEMPWRAGGYVVVLHPTLEDAAGNRPSSAFEASANDRPARGRAVLRREFRIGVPK